MCFGLRICGCFLQEQVRKTHPVILPQGNAFSIDLWRRIFTLSANLIGYGGIFSSSSPFITYADLVLVVANAVEAIDS